MSNAVSYPQAASQDLIAKLVKAGYLQSGLCNDGVAVANAIARLKQDLSDGGDDSELACPDVWRILLTERPWTGLSSCPRRIAANIAKLPETSRLMTRTPEPALNRGVALRLVARYSVFKEPRGLYREGNGWAENEHSARVKYDEHQELDLSERQYRARGY
jgi:hypothetical protein